MKNINRTTDEQILESIQNIYHIVPILYGDLFTIKRKDDSILGRWLGWSIAVLSWIATGFKEWNINSRCFIFGGTLYLPNGFFDLEPLRQYGLLLHELAHVNHQIFDDPDFLFSNTTKRPHVIKGFWSRLWWSVKYVFSGPFRADAEKWGYLQQLRTTYDRYGYIPSQIESWFIETFCSGSYGWMLSREDAIDLFDRLELQVRGEYKRSDWKDRLYLKHQSSLLES